MSGIEDLLHVLLTISKRHRRDPAGWCTECLNPWPCWTYRHATLQESSHILDSD